MCQLHPENCLYTHHQNINREYVGVEFYVIRLQTYQYKLLFIYPDEIKQRNYVYSKCIINLLYNPYDNTF